VATQFIGGGMAIKNTIAVAAATTTGRRVEAVNKGERGHLVCFIWKVFYVPEKTECNKIAAHKKE